MRGKKGEHLEQVYRWGERAARLSRGAFDPTVAPLIEFWGNDPQRLRAPGNQVTQKLDSLMAFVGIDKVGSVERNGDPFLKKKVPNVKLDLSGVIKGYTLDRMGELLHGMGNEFLMMRIGNKYAIHGHPSSDDHWKVPIGYPSRSLSNEKVLWLHIKRDTAAVATSGNFQEFYTKE